LKKFAKVFLVSLCILCLLTGCYSNDTTIKVTQSGKIKVEVTSMATNEGVELLFGAPYDELAPGMIQQLQSSITDADKETVEEVKENIDDKEFKGIKYTGKYDSLEEMYASQVYNTVAMNFSGAPVSANELSLGGAAVGIAFNEEKGLMGKVYSGKGAIDFGVFRDMMGINGDGVAKINVAFKFPFGSLTVSKGNKNIIVPTFKYEATSDGDPVEIDFKVLVPNYWAVLFIILFILLLIAVVLLSLKVKKLQRIIDGEDAEEISEEDGEVFISEDDENFFEGNEEKVEFIEEIPEEIIEETEEIIGETEEKPEDEPEN